MGGAGEEEWGPAETRGSQSRARSGMSGQQPRLQGPEFPRDSHHAGPGWAWVGISWIPVTEGKLCVLAEQLAQV